MPCGIVNRWEEWCLPEEIEREGSFVSYDNMSVASQLQGPSEKRKTQTRLKIYIDCLEAGLYSPPLIGRLASQLSQYL